MNFDAGINSFPDIRFNYPDGVIREQYTTDYDTDSSVKRIKTLRSNMISNTTVWIINYGLFKTDGTVSFVPRITDYLITFKYCVSRRVFS